MAKTKGKLLDINTRNTGRSQLRIELILLRASFCSLIFIVQMHADILKLLRNNQWSHY